MKKVRIKSGEVWTKKTNETEPLLSHRKTIGDIKTIAVCGVMGEIYEKSDYCVGGVRCAGGVILVWAFAENCRKQSFGC